MDREKFKLAPGMDDIEISVIEQPAQTVAQGVAGALYSTGHGKLFIRTPDGALRSTEIDQSYRANFLAFDHAGNLYYAAKHTGELKRSRDGGKTFEVCLAEAHGDCFRGFAVDDKGKLYVGSYGQDGPASLYYSEDDGNSWTSLKTFRCRHIHDVAVNPYNNWLYVVTGERKEPHALDAYRVFRSKDGGETWNVIVGPGTGDRCHTPRPLYLGIGFIKNAVILSTDHFEGDNGIEYFMDSGGAGPFSPERVYSTPRVDPEEAPPAYCWRFTKWGDHLYTVCRGQRLSVLYRSADGRDWRKAAELRGGAGLALEGDPWADSLHISGPGIAYRITPVLQGKMEATPTPDFGALLVKHDQRYETGLGKGYFHRSLADRQKYELLAQVLKDNRIAKNAKIADAGCGVGRFLLNARADGYTNILGIETNPRWLTALRRLYERAWPHESPRLALVERGSFSLVDPADTFDAVMVMGVFCGGGHGLDPAEAFNIAWRQLNPGGLFCFNIQPAIYGQEGPEPFIRQLLEIGFRKVRARAYWGSTLLTARKE